MDNTGMGLPLASPDDLDSVLDILKYAWVAGLYYINLFGKKLDAAQAEIANLKREQSIRPTTDKMHEKVDGEMAKVSRKLEHIEQLLWELKDKQGAQSHHLPHINLDQR